MSCPQAVDACLTAGYGPVLFLLSEDAKIVLGSVTFSSPMGNVPEKWWKQFRAPHHPLLPLYCPASFLDVPGQWMLTDCTTVRLPALTKHLSEGGRKAFQPLVSPLSVGKWERSLDLACWRDGKVGDPLRGMPGTKGCSMLSVWP